MSWNILRTEAEYLRDREPFLSKMVTNSILIHESFAPALCRLLANTFRTSCFDNDCEWEELFLSVFGNETYKLLPEGGVVYEPGMPDLVEIALLDMQVLYSPSIFI